MLITQQIKPLSPEAFDQRYREELAGREQVQFLRLPLATPLEAQQAADNDKATFDDRLALLLRSAAVQDWDRVLAQLGGMEQSAGSRPGMRWVRDAVLKDSRHREQLRQRMLDRASELAQQSAGVPESEELFLADHLRSLTGDIFENNEMLSLLGLLKPIYERQAEYLERMKEWNRARVDYLRRAGQSDEAIELDKQLATEYPHDYTVQSQYAQSLINSRRFQAAKDWLTRVIVPKSQWLPHEEEALRNVYTQMLRSQGNYAELVDYLATWIDQTPQGTTAYQQYLSALVKNDQMDAANERIALWIDEGIQADKLSVEARSRLQAAVQQAVGGGYDLYTDRINDAWLDPLAQAVLSLSLHDDRLDLAEIVMNRGQFRQTDACRRVRESITEKLADQVGTLSADQIQRFVNWILPDDPALTRRFGNKLPNTFGNDGRTHPIRKSSTVWRSL